jgi:hypothetical protein
MKHQKIIINFNGTLGTDSQYEESLNRKKSSIDYEFNENLKNLKLNSKSMNETVSITQQEDHYLNTSLSTSSSQLNVSSTTTTNQHLNTSLRNDSQFEEKEKLFLSTECELVTVTRIITGHFELTGKYIYFFDLTSVPTITQPTDNPDGLEFHSALMLNDNHNNLVNQTFLSHDLNTFNDFKIPLSHLKEVQLRRFNLRSSALEFFLIDQSSFFLNFNKNVSLL